MADRFWRTSGRLLALMLLAALSCAGALGQSIRLRNEVIDPASASQRQAMTAHLQAATPLSGLFLLQLTTPPDAVRRAELRAAGVDLVKYVPDNAFVARISQVSPATLAGMPFVRWFGPYQPAYKVHSRLAALAQAATNNQDLAVSILLAPRAAASDIQGVRLLLSAVHSESHLRQGTILRGLLPPKQLEALAASSAVLWIEKAPKRKLVDEAASKIVGGDDGRLATPTLTQQMGFTGTNVTVCVADTGLDSGNTNTMHPDLRGRVSGFRYYGALTDGSDGYGHGTHCAGIVAGNAATAETDTNT
ncbi:MAG: S8 family serine peptidase, partial [Limisphaerales bacterium]